MKVNPVLQAHGLSVHHAGKAVLHDFDLDLMPGELLVLVGPNGSGKSSALRALAGVQALSAGHVQLQGLDVHRHFLRLAQRIGGQVHGVEPVEVLEGKMACALAVAQLRAVGWGFAEKIR